MVHVIKLSHRGTKWRKSRLSCSWWWGEERNRGNCSRDWNCWDWRHAWKWRQGDRGDSRHCWKYRQARKWRQSGLRQGRLSGWQGWQCGLWQSRYGRQWWQCWFRQIGQLQKITSCFASRKWQCNEENQDKTIETCHAANDSRPSKIYRVVGNLVCHSRTPLWGLYRWRWRGEIYISGMVGIVENTGDWFWVLFLLVHLLIYAIENTISYAIDRCWLAMFFFSFFPTWDSKTLNSSIAPLFQGG